VHCYLLPGSDGWTLVDTGLGLPDTAARWEPLLRELDAPVARIVTHLDPVRPSSASRGAPSRSAMATTSTDGACSKLLGHADGHVCLLRRPRRDPRAHLERLVREGRAARAEDGNTVTYTAA
jgi:hypothetical protein